MNFKSFKSLEYNILKPEAHAQSNDVSWVRTVFKFTTAILRKVMLDVFHLRIYKSCLRLNKSSMNIWT